MRRILLDMLAVGSLILCAGVATLWARSLVRQDWVYLGVGNATLTQTSHELKSQGGMLLYRRFHVQAKQHLPQMEVRQGASAGGGGWEHGDLLSPPRHEGQSFLGFGYARLYDRHPPTGPLLLKRWRLVIFMPHWFPMILFGMLPARWMRVRWFRRQ